MARNFAEQLGVDYDLDPRGSTYSAHLTKSQHNPYKHLQTYYYAGFEGGGVFAGLLVLLYST